MIVVGAGLSGLVAAHAFPHARIVEAAPAPRQTHAALLRFRSEVVANLIGVEFRRVRVHKGIWFGGRFHAPDIRLANWYALKTIDHISDRSIWDIDTVDRFIAPESLYEDLVGKLATRIQWGYRVENFAHLRSSLGMAEDVPILSTMPMVFALRAAGIDHAAMTFSRAPIAVRRVRLANCDVFQTVYFPDPEVSTYRASITGSLLTMEGTTNEQFHGDAELDAVLRAFGDPKVVEALPNHTQHYGKIAPIDEHKRKSAMFQLTYGHRVYSIGRYGVWKNILLDDVIQDLAVVRKLITAANFYDQHLQLK
jgi:hypothetical protein